MKMCSNLPRVSVTLYLLVMLFNLSSWIDLRGAWSELPLLVHSLPENWALGSYITITNMIGNIALWIFFFGNMYIPKIFRHVPAIYTVIFIGFTSRVLLAFFWQETAHIGGELHSVALLTLMTCLASVDHVSSAAFFAYMVILPSEYMSAFYVGDGLCGLIPSLLGLIQGASGYDCVNFTQNVTSFELKQIVHPPLFSVSIFFGLLAFIMAVSGTAFSLINYLPWARKFHVRSIDKKEKKGVCIDGYIEGTGEGNIVAISYTPSVSKLKDDASFSNESVFQKNCESSRDSERVPQKTNVTKKDSVEKISKLETTLLLALFSYVFGMRYGCLRPLQSYSLLPYGQLAYSLGNRLDMAVMPLVAFAALFHPTRSTKRLTLLICLGTVPAVCIIVLAAYSPYPPLHGSDAGIWLSVIAWILTSAFWEYAKVGISIRLKEQGKKTLMVAGLCHHLGQIVPALLTFFLIREGYFKNISPC